MSQNKEKQQFKQRQSRLIGELKKENAIAIIASNSEMTRSHDTEFPFRQHSDFLYLSGFQEPESILIISARLEEPVQIFLRPKSAFSEMWNGKRLGVDEAPKKLAVDLAFEISTFDKKIPELIFGHDKVYFDFKNHTLRDQVFLGIKNCPPRRRAKMLPPSHIGDLQILTGPMKLIKSEEEINLMKKANAISTKAHLAAMSVTAPSKNEYEVSAVMNYIFTKEGATGPAYGNIVAGGTNALCLHYTENNQPLKDGDLLLIDAGSEYEGYSSDITRTFPVNGKFSEAQKDIYNLVLDSQLKAIESCAPGKTMTEINSVATNVLTQGLIDLKILKGTVKENIANGAIKKYYPHGTGHWLGLDVHDVCPYLDENREDILFSKGMTFTIEPGLYFPIDDQDVPEKYRGIGIRIEDDILITDKGYENLTNVAKTIEEVEAACASKMEIA